MISLFEPGDLFEDGNGVYELVNSGEVMSYDLYGKRTHEYETSRLGRWVVHANDPLQYVLGTSLSPKEVSQ